RSRRTASSGATRSARSPTAWGSKTRSGRLLRRWPGSVGFPVWWRPRVLWSLAYLVVRRLFELMLLCCRSPRSKELEILVLRHELSILRRHGRRPQLREADRLFLAALSRALPRRAWSAFSVSPRTLLRGHPRLVARRWTYPHRRPGRPAVDR